MLVSFYHQYKHWFSTVDLYLYLPLFSPFLLSIEAFKWPYMKMKKHDISTEKILLSFFYIEKKTWVSDWYIIKLWMEGEVNSLSLSIDKLIFSAFKIEIPFIVSTKLIPLQILTVSCFQLVNNLVVNFSWKCTFAKIYYGSRVAGKTFIKMYQKKFPILIKVETHKHTFLKSVCLLLFFIF